jgi:O-antigen/teichoic acid export membrane protein
MNKSKLLGFALGPLGSAAIGFVTLPMLAWFFSAEDIGRIAMLQVATNFAVILFTFGLDQSYAREYHETADKPALLKAATLPGLATLAVLLLALLALRPGLLSQALFAVDDGTLSAIAAASILATFVSRFLSVILRMEEKGFAFSMSQVLPKLLFLALVVAYALAVPGRTFLMLVAAYTVSIVAVMFAYAWNTRHAWVPALAARLDRRRLRHLVAFGFPLIFGGVASWALMAMDRVFLRQLSTLTELGVFSVAASIAAAAGIVSSIFSTVWAPTVYRWAAEGDAQAKIDAATHHLLAAVVLIFVATGLLSWVLALVLPATYDRVQYIVAASLAPPLLYALSECAAVGISLARRSMYSMAASFLAAAANVAGNYLLVPRLGAGGAAISTAVSFLLFLVVRTEFSCRVWRPVPRVRLYLATTAVTALAVAFVLYGERHRGLFLLMWAGLGLLSLAWFRSSLSLAARACAKAMQGVRLRATGLSPGLRRNGVQ